MKAKKERIEYLDLLKGISIILVVFCHKVTLPSDTILGNIIMAMAWAAVPNFFFVTGGLMHQSKELKWKKYLNKLLRAYIVLCVWKLLYLLFYSTFQEVTFSKTDLIEYLFMFGDISGVTEGGMGREATDKELSGGVICDGLGSSFAALLGVLPNTSFSQNVGLVAMTKVVNRFALATGAGFLILCGLIPKLGALVSIMPQSVLGGAAVMMFSSIVISGIMLITKEPLNGRSLSIVSVALGVGYGIGANPGILVHTPQFVQLIFGGSGIVPAAIVAILLNILLPKE